MDFPFYIARRYLVSKKTKNVVNIISGIATVGVVVGTMALVIVLSVFNGFDVLIKSFFSVFDPEIKITTLEGKHFDPDSEVFQVLRKHPDLVYFCETVEEIAHFRYDERQYIARIKGVDEEYLEMTHLDSFIYDGTLLLSDANFDYTVLGRGLAYNLGASPNFIAPVWVSVPKKGNRNMALTQVFRQEHLVLSGIYSVGQQEVDEQYALIPIHVARRLLDLEHEVTSIELQLRPGIAIKKFQKTLQALLGPGFVVQNRYQQHESYYRVANSERFFIYLTLSFILVIASFNLASSIAMLILDKRKDINILVSLGLTRKKLGTIFLYEGILVSTIGGLAGLVLGVLVCLGQMHFGWLKFPGSFAVEFYPVDLRFSNLLLIAATVLVIGSLASWLPVRFLPKRFFRLRED
ncbi:MAG TPA: FtsX-like permease family protein [Prolixibacteraceae bacterium]|nr:FtsX-like permease family protein [Prolixibacteraceae bacterium]